ncbi:hypothetical protein FRB99_008736 [Tulasnella sp. 403]|nr:hypothetical protein FRB99_008736 [Tulasnella sp. 403]
MPRLRLIVYIFLTFAALVNLGRRSRTISGAVQRTSDYLKVAQPLPVRRRHVAIISKFNTNGEVYGIVAWTLNRIFTRNPELRGWVKLYTQWDEQRFVELAQELGMVPGEIHPVDDIYDDLARRDFATGENESIDLIWDMRPADKKFQVVCIVHNGLDTTWFGELREWTRRGAMRFLPISEHVAASSRSVLRDLSDMKYNRTELDALYEYVKIDVHYCIADLSSLIVPRDEGNGRGLANVMIQGNFDPKRRDYEGTFSELVASLKEDPAAWGYLADNSGRFEPDPNSIIPPFELHLAGMSGQLDIPLELKNIVKIHWQLSARPFYQVAQSMDVIIPSFVSGDRYYEAVGSSTIHTAVECNVPLLASRRLREAYKFLDDAATIVRPQAISEIQALKALRTGIPPQLATNNPMFVADVERMMAQGWRRPREGFEKLKERLWTANEQVIDRILRDE